MGEKDRLQDIPQFRTLEENLELRVALQQVDKLKAENVALKAELDEWKDEIIQMPGVVERPIDEDDESHYPSMEEEAKNDWAHDSYENLVDPEFDRGYNMGYAVAIDDIMNHLRIIRNKGGA